MERHKEFDEDIESMGYRKLQIINFLIDNWIEYFKQSKKSLSHYGIINLLEQLKGEIKNPKKYLPKRLVAVLK